MRHVSIPVSCIEGFINTFYTWMESEGKVGAATRCKTNRLALTRYLAGHPLQTPAGIALTKDGLPKCIPALLRDEIRAGNPRAASLALTLLSVSRLLLGGSPINTRAITDPGSGSVSETLKTDIKKAIKALRLKLDIPSWDGYHHTSKSGPNGPALGTALIDLEGITPSRLNAIRTLAPQLAEKITLLNYLSLIGILDQIQDKILPRKYIQDSKLSVKEDKETKSRVFAILDYGSQDALYPLHKALFKLLKGIAADCSFEQSAGLDLQVPDGHSYHSVDLTNATDRFPSNLIEGVLCELSGRPEIGIAWRELMVNREFALKGAQYHYGTGQPMGAYSSGASFTLCHHLIVQVAALRSGLTLPFNGYRMLGDDIVIAHNAVADHYRRILQELDVHISEAKTHVSKDTFEFAKRGVGRGEEITPFPLNAFLEGRNHSHVILQTVKDMKAKGISFAVTTGEPQSVAILLRALGLKGRLLDSKINMYVALSVLPKVGDGELEVGAGAYALLASQGTTIPCRPFKVTALLGRALASEVCKEQVVRVADELDARFSDLMKEIRDVVESIDHPGSADQAELMNQIISHVPATHVSADLAAKAGASVGVADSMVNFDMIYEWLARTHVIVAPYRSLRFVRRHHLLAASKPRFIRDMRQKVRTLLGEFEPKDV